MTYTKMTKERIHARSVMEIDSTRSLTLSKGKGLIPLIYQTCLKYTVCAYCILLCIKHVGQILGPQPFIKQSRASKAEKEAEALLTCNKG